MRSLMITAAILFSLVGGVACQKDNKPTVEDTESASPPKVTAADVQKKLSETFAVTAAYAREQKDIYAKRIQTELAELDKQIAALKEKSGGASGEARDRYQKLAGELSGKREVVKRNLEQFKAAGGESWKNAQGKIDAAMKDLKDAYRRTTEKPENKPAGQ